MNMNGFSIEFLPDISDAEIQDMLRYGTIKIGDFQEKFLSSVSFWSIENYQYQWKEGIELISSGLDASCLITSMYDPDKATAIHWWLMYRDGNIIHFQNNLLLLDYIDDKFDIANPYKAIPQREIYTDEGEQISEWHITLFEIEQFLHLLKMR